MMKSKFGEFLSVVVLSIGITFVLAACEGQGSRDAYFAKGKELFETGDLARARLELKNALQIDNKFADAWLLMGQVEERSGDLGRAYADYSKAVELAPDLVDARVRKATILLAAKQLDKAAEDIAAALAQAPDNADALAALASLEFRRDDKDAAEKDARRVLEIDPGHSGAGAILATLQIANKEYADAEGTLQAAIGANPDKAGLRMLLAKVYELEGNSERLVELLHSLVADFPDEFTYRLALAKYLVGQQRQEEAEDVLRKAVEAAPDDAIRQRVLVELVMRIRGMEAARTELAAMTARQPNAIGLKFIEADLLQAGNEAEAVEKTYRDIIELSGGTGPDAIKARNALAQRLIKEKRNDEAAALIDAVLAESSREPDALQLRAVLALQKKDPAQAVADLRSVLRDYPERVAAVRLLGQAHAMQQEYALAQDALEKAIAMQPDEQTAYLLLAEVQSRTGDLDGAQATMERLLEKVPESAVAQQVIAKIQMSERDWVGLAERGNKIKAQNPDHPLGYYLEGLAMQQQGKHAEAIVLFDQALERKAGALEPLIASVRSQLALGQAAQAQERLEGILKDKPDNLVALTILGDIYLAGGSIEKAMRVLNDAARYHPASPRAYLRLAQVQLGKGDRAGARKTLEKGVGATDSNALLAMELANLVAAMGDREAAIKLYDDVITRNPEALGPVNNLAMLLATDSANQSELDRALELTARLKDSNLPAFLDTVGWVHYLRGEYDLALPFLEKAVTGTPDSPELHYHVGMTYAKLGRVDDSREHLAVAASAQNFPLREEAQRTLTTMGSGG